MVKNVGGQEQCKGFLLILLEYLFIRTHTLIAVGGTPIIPKDIPGAEYGTDSDGFFRFDDLPKFVLNC